MRLTKDITNKLLDLEKLYSSDTVEELIKTVSSELSISPESMRNIFEGKERVTAELAQKIDEIYEKEYRSQSSEERKKAMLRKLHGKKPNLDQLDDRIENLWEEKFGNQDKESTEEDRTKKISKYGELKFFEKVLAQRDFNDKLFGLQDIPNIPNLGENVTVVDCNDGEEYHTSIQTSQYLISTGLKSIWDKFNRRRRLKPGEVIGIALDPQDNHIIYVDFEYNERKKVAKMEDDQKHITGDVGQMEEKKVGTNKEIKDGEVIVGNKRTITTSKEQRLMDIYDVIIQGKKWTVFERELIPKEVEEKQFVLKYIVDECKKSYPNAKFPKIGENITFVNKNDPIFRVTGKMDGNTYVAPRVLSMQRFMDYFHPKAYENGNEKKGDMVKFYIDTEGMNDKVMVEFLREVKMDKQKSQDTIQSSQDTEFKEIKDIEIKEIKDIEIKEIKDSDIEKKEKVDLENTSDIENKEKVDLENKEKVDLENKEEVDLENKETRYNRIITYLKNNGLIPNDISEEQMNTLVDQYGPKIKAFVEDARNRALESIAKDCRSRILAENKMTEKENLEKEQKKKEDERRAAIDGELEIISKLPYDDLERLLHDRKNVNIDGPSYVEKTSTAEKYAARYISRFVKAETDNKLKEFSEKGYIEILPSHADLVYAAFVEGYQYDDNGKPILKPGLLKIMSARALGSAIGFDNKDIDNNWKEVFNEYKEKEKLMSEEDIDKLFKYSIPHILIVPDFARGDAIKILGPTNTIIDKNYRIRGRDGIPIRLQDSGDEFIIPPNLFIIVDKNNTRSAGIQPIDEATERRFATHFMSSKFENISKFIDENRKELENNGSYDMFLVSLDTIIKLNNKIIKKFGKDKELGHAYLYIMTLDELFIQWKNYILPLLFIHRCERDHNKLNNLLFNEKESQFISSEKGIYGLNNIEDLKNFLNKMNNGLDQDEIDD